MNSPRFDLTINLGHVLTFGGLLVTMAIGWGAFDGRLTRVEEILRTATATLVEQVRQGTELRALSERVSRNERSIETILERARP